MNINADQFIMLKKTKMQKFTYNSYIKVGVKMSPIRFQASLNECIEWGNNHHEDNPAFSYEIARIENNIVTHLFTADEAKRLLKISKL